jgi:putative transposase
MVRPLRIAYPDALYHITSRGNERKPVFRQEADYQAFLTKLEGSGRRYGIRLYAYVLMSNHIHLLVETPQGNLSRYLQHLLGSYTSYFNRFHSRSGHLFGGRFKARLVDGSRYLMNLTRYMHLNPVRIRRGQAPRLEEQIQQLREYRWSSYRSYAGLDPLQEFVDYSLLGGMVGEYRREQGCQAYREYVETGLARRDEELEQALSLSSKAIGSQDFCRWAEQHYAQLVKVAGHPTTITQRRVEVGIDPERVMELVCREYRVGREELRRFRNRSVARWMAMKLLQECSALSLEQVAQQVGLKEGSRVSHCRTEIDLMLRQDATLQRQYEQLQTLLRGS